MKNISLLNIIMMSLFLLGITERTYCATTEYSLIKSGDKWRYSDSYKSGWSKKNFNDSKWKKGETPFDDQSVSGNCNFGGDGTDWPLFSTKYLRKNIDLTKNGDVEIYIAIDNDIDIYFDGSRIDSIESENCARRWQYKIIVPSVKKGKHSIAVKITDRGVENGFDLIAKGITYNYTGIVYTEQNYQQIHAHGNIFVESVIKKCGLKSTKVSLEKQLPFYTEEALSGKEKQLLVGVMGHMEPIFTFIFRLDGHVLIVQHVLILNGFQYLLGQSNS